MGLVFALSDLRGGILLAEASHSAMKSTLVFSLALIGSVVVLYLGVSRNTHKDRASGCRSNLKAWCLGIAQYRKDFDAKYPPIEGSPHASGLAWKDTGFGGRTKLHGEGHGWAEAVYPYVGGLSLYRCPDGQEEKISFDSRRPQFTAYWFNENLGKVRGNSVQHPQQTLMLGDGADAPELGLRADARFHLHALPPAWMADRNSPLFRHLGGANYAFSDGYVRWLRPDQVKNFGGRPDPFSIR